MKKMKLLLLSCLSSGGDATTTTAMVLGGWNIPDSVHVCVFSGICFVLGRLAAITLAAFIVTCNIYINEYKSMVRMSLAISKLYTATILYIQPL